MFTTHILSTAGSQKHSLRSKTFFTSTHGDATRTPGSRSRATSGPGATQSTMGAAFDRGFNEGLHMSTGEQAAIALLVVAALGYLVTRVALRMVRAAGRAWRGEGRT